MNLLDMIAAAPALKPIARTLPTLPALRIIEQAPAKTGPYIGAAISCTHRGLGYVTGAKKPEHQISILGRGGLIVIELEYECAFASTIDTIDDQSIGGMLEPSRPDCADVAAWREQALAAKAAKRVDREAEMRAADVKRKAFQDEARAAMPAGTKAVIVAVLKEDDSDYSSDYHNSRVLRSVIIGWSTHTRDLFPEMRKAALNFAETAHLHDAPSDAEHREKYSMGAGFYLKQGWRDQTGWHIEKMPIHGEGFPLTNADWSLGEPKGEAITAASVDVGGYTISEHMHTKRGVPIWIASLEGRVDRDDFDTLRDAAKAAGGWYSRQWGKTPGGFAFLSEAEAVAFVEGQGITPPISEKTHTPAAKSAPRAGVADKLRMMADGLQKDIDAKFSDRRENTPKQMREAATARIDGGNLERAQKIMRALADHHDAGTVPPVLAGITTKAAIVELAQEYVDRSHSGYYDAGIATGKVYPWQQPAKQAQAAALWGLLTSPVDPDRAKRDALKRKIDALKFASIPGYFPTPAPIVEMMIEQARLEDGMSVLEPSAGSGAILDGVAAGYPDTVFTVFERQHSLYEILEDKGYNLAGRDFTDAPTIAPVDRVLMNPPFERGQDIEHVRLAFDMLKDGGRLVSIMSPGPFFRSDAKAEAFRHWFDDIGGEKFDLPEGSFKASGAGVSTVLIVVDKEGGQ